MLMMRALVGVLCGGRCHPKTSTTRIWPKLKKRVDDAFGGRFWDPPWGTQKMRPGAQIRWEIARFSRYKLYLKIDALREPHLEPDVGEPTGSAA